MERRQSEKNVTSKEDDPDRSGPAGSGIAPVEKGNRAVADRRRRNRSAVGGGRGWLCENRLGIVSRE